MFVGNRFEIRKYVHALITPNGEPRVNTQRRIFFGLISDMDQIRFDGILLPQTETRKFIKIFIVWC